MRRSRRSLRRLGRTLLPLAVAYGAGLWLLAALLLELHVHRSTLLGLVSALPASGLAVWFSRHERRRFDRRAVVWSVVRGALLFALFAGMLWLFDYPTKNRAAWAIWVPLMTLDFAPSMLTALPWLALGCLGGLFISYDLVVLRWRRLPFVVAYLWPAVWAFFAFTGFYRASFDTIDPAVVTRQPGVRVLAPSGVEGCGLFAARCSNRLFPRAMGVDTRTRTLFAGFGSTASDLVRGQPMLLALEVDTGAATWLPGSDAANQIRNVAVDEAERLLAVGQWGSHRVALYDLERRELAAELGYRSEERGEFQPITVLLDGDRVLVVNIWYPRVVELSRATGAVTRVVDLYDLGLVGNGVQLAGAGLSQRRGRLWIAIAQTGANLLELDLATLAPGRSVDLDTTFPGSFTYDDVGGRIYLTSFRSAAIEVVDVDGMREVDEIEGTLGARETAVDPERGLLFVMDYLRGRVLFHSLAERRVVRSVAVGPKPGGAVVFDGTLYVNATVGVVAIPLD